MRRLTEAAGVSGSEGEVRSILKDEVGPHTDEMRVDPLGNLITVKKGKGAGPRVMVAAHMDEIGLMVSWIEKGGLLRFKKVGGIDDRVLVSKVVYIGADKVPGVIGAKPVHLQEASEREKPIKYDQLYIDIGAKSREEAEKKVKMGDAVAFATRYEEIGRGYAKAKAFDDRIGCAVLAETLKNSYDFPLYGVFTVQEEVGLRGAATAAYSVEPDLAVVLEGTTCSDTPETKEHGYATTLGAGPAISLMDATSIANKKMVAGLVKVAEENGIPYQFRRTTFGGNDAGRIHLTRQGVAACTLSVPTRYIHSPASVIHLDDFANACRLLDLFLKSIEKGELQP